MYIPWTLGDAIKQKNEVNILLEIFCSQYDDKE